jgi:2-methylcitrate dehydratase PrpD
MDTANAGSGRRAGPKGITRKLARHAATLRYDALPPALVEMIKQCVLDTFGVSIGASTMCSEERIVGY